MSKNLYKVGYRAEIRAKKQMEAWKYLTIRSARSGGPFDLIGISKTRVLAVQVKVVPFGKVYAFNKLKKEIAAIPVPEFVKKELWVWERSKGFHYFPL